MPRQRTVIPNSASGTEKDVYAVIQVSADGRRSVDARELLAQCREMVIVHKGQLYRLQATRQGKLILTK